MSEIVVYLIQNFASHLLAAVITFLILKYLLQNFSGPCSSRVANRRRSCRRQDSHQGRSNTTVRESSSLALDRNSSESKSRSYKKGKQAYVLSEEGYLKPVIERDSNVYITSVHVNDNEESEASITPVKPPLPTNSKRKSSYDVNQVLDKPKATVNELEKLGEALEEDIIQPTNSPQLTPSKVSIHSKNPPSSDVLESTKLSSQRSRVSNESLSQGSMVFKKPPSQSTMISKEPLSQGSRVSKKTPSQDTKISKESLSRGSRVFKKPSSQSTMISKEPLSQASRVSEDTLSQGPRVSKKPPPQGSMVSNEPSSRCSMKSECDISHKPERFLVCPKRPQYRYCESIHGDELVQRSLLQLCQSDFSSDDDSREYSQGINDFHTEMEKGDWTQSPYCLRSPSNLMSKRYYDRQAIEKRSESDSFRTVVIDFKPGLFLSCFSKCCKKLFAIGSKNDSDSDECQCNCRGRKFNPKAPMLSSKTKGRHSKRRNNVRNYKAERSNKKFEPSVENLQQSPPLSGVNEDKSSQNSQKQEDVRLLSNTEEGQSKGSSNVSNKKVKPNVDNSQVRNLNMKSSQSLPDENAEEGSPNTKDKQKHDPPKSQDKEVDDQRVSLDKEEDDQRKSQDKEEDDQRKSQDKEEDDQRKSQDKEEDDQRKSQDKMATTAYCSVGVSTHEEDDYDQSQKRNSLIRLESFRSDSVLLKRHSDSEDFNDSISSSSSESSYNHLLRKMRKDKRPYGYLKNDLKSFSECSNAFPVFSKPRKKRKSYKQEGPSLIGWQKEESSNKEGSMDSFGIYDVSETSLIQYSSETSEIEPPLPDKLNHEKNIVRKDSFLSEASNDSEKNRVLRSKNANAMNPTDFCGVYEVDNQMDADYRAADSEEGSSIDDEIARDFVKSFHTILSEMGRSTHNTSGQLYSMGCRKKYRIKMNTRPIEQGFNNTQLSYNPMNLDKCEDGLINNSDNNLKNNEVALKKENVEPTVSHLSIIKNIEINSTESNESKIGETDTEIKYSIEKNLADLESLFPSLSEQISSTLRVPEKDSTSKMSLNSNTKTSNLAKNGKGLCVPFSDKGSEVFKCHQEKRAESKTNSKPAENQRDGGSTRPCQSSNNTSEIEDSVKKRLVKLGALSSLEVLSKPSSHRALTKDPLTNHSSERINSEDVEGQPGPLKRFKTRDDLSVLGITKQSKSSHIVGNDKENKTCKLPSKGKSLSTFSSKLNEFDEVNSEEEEDSKPTRDGENDRLAIPRKSRDSEIHLQADFSKPIESSKMHLEKTSTFRISVADRPPEISLGSLDSKELSSYTILDLGLPSDTRTTKVSLFPSNMNDSWLVLQRQGSNDIHKHVEKIYPRSSDSLNEEIEFGNMNRPVLNETSPKRFSETQIKYDTCISPDSEDDSETIVLK
nr:uncharacterized protein DDB_G0283697 [Halyomorpha halys]